MANPVVLALAAIGAAVVLQFTHAALNFLTFHFLKPTHALQAYRGAPNAPTYALITGSSGGIGLGIAHELTRQGFGVILLGHLPDDIAAAARSLPALNPAAPPPRTIILNAETASPDAIADAVSSIADLDVSILVNNVGSNPVAEPNFRPLATYAAADVDAVINLNARFMARLTARMLPLLSRRRPSGPSDTKTTPNRALIINVASLGMVGLPWLTMYGATKAFDFALSAGLARELAAHPATAHVDCLAVVPGDVRSQGNSAENGIAVPANAPVWDAYGREIVLKAEGAVARGWLDMTPHWRHDLERALLARLPLSVATKGMTDMMRVKKDGLEAFYAKRR
ncbi:hypothetical protein B0T22DRAFT_473808 [Podospora appendiculata]|uniref:Uncharacterized protein n=1 Tax=Podospora appendiculata TaxID=314037 RepID=A0AAE0WZH4_9PEZI|nr:hypothetical protein B0T22DRAFT_473808 [Podospora appendiculata]